MNSEGTRLNKFLATRLGVGRREADSLIAKGRVTINGIRPALGARVQNTDKVTVDDKPVDSAPTFLYVLMNKPEGYVCSKRQQGDTPTIYSLLPKEYQHLKTVGRLDKDSSGLIMLTNDGDLAHRLTHPKFTKIKKYEVTLNRPLEPQHRQAINDVGVNLPDGSSKLGLEPLKNDSSWLITMHEGRNRQIRRTFEALDYAVERLHRIQFGDYKIGSLQPGSFRIIQPIS